MTLSEAYRLMHGYYNGYERPKHRLVKSFCVYYKGIFRKLWQKFRKDMNTGDQRMENQ